MAKIKNSLLKELRRALGIKPRPKKYVIGEHMVWKDQPYFKRAQAKATMTGIPDIRCYFLQSCLRSLADVPGHVAECGVREGKSSLYMIEACEQDRTFYLFDSFAGLSDPVGGKDLANTAIDETTGQRRFATDIEIVERNLAEYSNVRLMKGWIPDRFPEVANESFCFAHIDVDLYEPTRDAIEFFYSRLSPQGIIVCDDYGSGYYPGSRQAMDEFFAARPETPIELPQGQSFIIKR